MTTINAVFKGEHKNLEMLLFSGIKDYSTKILATNTLSVSWFIDEHNYEKALQNCMDLVDMSKVELWNIDVNYIK